MINIFIPALIFLSGVLNSVFGVHIWRMNPKKELYRIYGIFAITSACWVFSDFIFRILPNTFTLKNAYAVGSVMPAVGLIWILNVCRVRIKRPLVLFLLVVSILFLVLSYFTDLIIVRFIEIKFAGYVGETGKLFPIFAIYFFIVFSYLVYKLYATRIRSKGIEKQQLLFVFWGVAIFIFIVLLVSLFLPLFGILEFTSLDAPSSLIFISLTGYSIVRYRFMDIRAIIFRTITFGFILLLITSIFAVIATLISSLFAELAGVQSNIIAGLFIAFLVTTFYIPVRNLIERVTNTFLYKRAYNSDLLLSKVNEVTSSTLDLQELLTSVCNLIENAVNCEKIGVALLDEKKNKLKVTYKKGFLPGIAEMFVSFPGVVRLMFRQFQETPGIFVVDERKTQYDNGEFKPVSPIMLNLLHENNLALVVPLYAKEKLIGVLVIGTKKSGDPYATRDIRTLNIISGQFAVAIDRAQLYGHLEELVAERTEELHVANEKLESANVQLKKLDAAKSEFISIASHQLRSPLTAIKGYISMMQEGDFGKVPQNLIRYLNIVYMSNERLISLVNDLLNISRIESGRQRYDFTKNDLYKLAEEIVINIKPKAVEKKLELILEKPTAPLLAVCDGEKIHEVMMNFVDNAIKYTKSGRITIALKPEPSGMITFKVIDTGMGIAKENMLLLFKKFSRVEGSFLVHTEGTGLGLYVAKLYIEVHGGRIWAESEGEGKGSTFSFSIPIKGPKKPPTIKDEKQEERGEK